MKGSSQEVLWCEGSSLEQYVYHAHDYREVLEILKTNAEGLEEEEVKTRQNKYGLNQFTKKDSEKLWKTIYKHLRSPLVFVLLSTLAVTIALSEYVDAIVIALALAVAVIISILQEGKASKAFSKLKKSQSHFATVLRAGSPHKITAETVTIGDIVILESGMKVPADLRLLKTKQLSINEEALTGEWVAVEKHTKAVAVGAPLPERNNMAWLGTYVAKGYGLGIVTAIGDDTEVGKLAGLVDDIKDTKTPLQIEMERISHFMLYIIGGLVVFIFLIGLLQGQPLQEMLLTSVAVAVASIPEGLPAAVTIILAVGMEALLKRGGLMRSLIAAETLGSTTYVLTDKTGTLTEAKMTVKGMINGKGVYLDGGDFTEMEEVKKAFKIALVASNAYVDQVAEKKILRGDPLEQAILRQANKLQIKVSDPTYRNERLDFLAFDSEQRFAAGLSKFTDKENYLCINGSPALLIASANKVLFKRGEEKFLPEQKQVVLDEIENQTTKGKRLFAIAYKKVEYEEITSSSKDLLKDIVLVGVVVLDDPVRPGVTEVILSVQEAGAEVMLITGDNAKTALAVARDVGIAKSGDTVLVGSELEKMSDNDLLTAFRKVKVFARILPKQKMRIASLLQQRGEIVAMTGDGINDAPALRRANIGIAIGSGTEVAKESSDLILVNDSFATIHHAIEEGRRIINNLRKVVGYLLSTSLSEAVLITVALLLGAAVPILPTQILWANIIEEGLMSVAFAFEKGDKDLMKQKPQDIQDEGILSKSMLWFMAYVVTILSMMIVGIYLYFLNQGLEIDKLRSVMFITISVDSLFLAFAFRSLTLPAWRMSLKDNKFFIGSFFVSFALLLAVIEVPFFQKLLHYEPLTLNQFVIIGCFGLLSLLVIETGKWLYFRNKV